MSAIIPVRAGEPSLARRSSRTVNTTATDMQALSGLQMPILLVQGEKDNVLPKDMIAQTNAALPQATLYIVPGGGHMSNENKAAEVAAVTVDFLSN